MLLLHTTHLLQDGPVDGGGELASLVEAGAEETGDLLDDRVGGQESMVGLGCGQQQWGSKKA